eukprot:Blabericola_migrator_1__13461@NODE_971_length_5863_cov_9_131470_g673_i0_p1_GENE_NODE_971_length_5863_cov_9_131470_g673_i0NODE_971_length_5863_cov_9_131470_g673_i0_p1_ORF_typecomplete_len666_score94_44CSN7a_helixI/PF18392_1/8_6e03CSN7a_helixI/PF18392_1/2_6e03CSN7a_helixI/PF18392_1/0_75_NODE_971_length_5863_cov_9_131470_g673_i01272124
MSARRLRRPTPISAPAYRWLGTSIVTTLAVLPRRFSVNSTEPSSQERHEPSAGQPSSSGSASLNVLASAEEDGGERRIEPNAQVKLLAECLEKGEDGKEPASEPPARAAEAVLTNPPYACLNVQNFRASFNGPEIPVFIGPESRSKQPNVGAVRSILRAYGNEHLVQGLMVKKFPNGDFQYHLGAYIRNKLRSYKDRARGTLEARLMTAYVTGLKHWCATVHDLFISQMESELSTGVKTGQVASAHFHKQAAAHQKAAVKSLSRKAFRANPMCHAEWRKYKESLTLSQCVKSAPSTSARKRRKVMVKKGPYFISWLLRTSSPEFFLREANDIAHAIKIFGGPCHLINLIQHMYLHEEDVAEYEQLRRSVQGAVNTDLPEDASKEVPNTSMTLPVDLPKVVEYLGAPLSILLPDAIAEDFGRQSLPPFLQLGYGLEYIKVAPINKIVELYDRGEEDEALSVMDKEFVDAEEFQAHFFGLLRKAMRSYAFVPKLSEDSNAFYPYDSSTSLGELLNMYIEGLQEWCANVHDVLCSKIDDAIQAAHLSRTGRSDYFIHSLKAVEPAYTRALEWVMNRTDVSLVPPPPPVPLALDSEVARLREGLHASNWLIRNMSWDCFLFFRANLAATVREIDRGKEGFSFLANILESLSFTNRDANEFKQYYSYMME